MSHLTSGRILGLGTAFWASKVLQTAVELDIFTALEQQSLSAKQLCDIKKLHPRAVEDFLDALVAMKLLNKQAGNYETTDEASHFLVKGKASYIGGVIILASQRGYALWQHLPALIKTGEPQSEVKDGGDFFKELYSDPTRLKQFIVGMSGLSQEPIDSLVKVFDWASHETFCDLGTAQGALPAALVNTYPSLIGYGFDLPPVAPIFNDYIAEHDAVDKVKFIGGNFFTDELPNVDVMIYGHILHGWNAQARVALLEKAYGSLNHGGAVIVYDAMIDDERSVNLHGLLMSLNLRIETKEGHDYTGKECKEWFNAAGFSRIEQKPLTPTVSMVCGYKE